MQSQPATRAHAPATALAGGMFDSPASRPRRLLAAAAIGPLSERSALVALGPGGRRRCRSPRRRRPPAAGDSNPSAPDLEVGGSWQGDAGGCML
eukprot:361433-Chlamydomonas_euryale.AAC.3